MYKNRIGEAIFHTHPQHDIMEKYRNYHCSSFDSNPRFPPFYYKYAKCGDISVMCLTLTELSRGRNVFGPWVSESNSLRINCAYYLHYSRILLPQVGATEFVCCKTANCNPLTHFVTRGNRLCVL